MLSTKELDAFELWCWRRLLRVTCKVQDLKKKLDIFELNQIELLYVELIIKLLVETIKKMTINMENDANI